MDLAKSTAHAIYVIRRIQAFAESTGEPLFLALLDWEKAFDKVDHGTLLDALRRLDIHEHVIKALEDGYQKATFFTKETNLGNQKRKPKALESGKDAHCHRISSS